jgi:hypothetical protein
MSFSDFVSNWDAVQMCHLNADSYSDELLKETYVIHSSFIFLMLVFGFNLN